MDFDKNLRLGINEVKRGIKKLRKLDLKLEIQETETMMGNVATHVYVTDSIGGKVFLQKHLFTVEG